MKKNLFFLVVLIGSGILILLSFSKTTTPENINMDFSEGEKIYNWDASKKIFTETSLSGSKKGDNVFLMHRLSPIDSIYYLSKDNNPLIIEKKNGINTVTLGSGLFVCNIQTGLEKYIFRTKDLILTPADKGIFFVNSTENKVGVFSFDAFLDTQLVNIKDSSATTKFTLFPSLLFTHDPKNTQGLKGADILRISIIDNIRYIDIRAPDDSKMLFLGKDDTKNSEFLAVAQKDISNRTQNAIKLYNAVLSQDEKKLRNSSFLSTSSPFLINGSKKEILLKNLLIKDILSFLQDPKNLQHKNNINDTLSEMKSLDVTAYENGISLLKQYYYIGVFSRFADSDNFFDFTQQSPSFLNLVEETLSKNNKDRTAIQRESYTHISDLFSVYYFLTLSQTELNNSFEKILQKILDNKVLTKDEFLPFVFFVTQYLSTGPSIPNEDTLLIISHLIRITNDYYASNNSDKSKLTTITSTIFYNYTRIFKKIHSIFLNTFVDKTPEGLLIKTEYLNNENTIFEQNFIEIFSRIIKQARSDIESKKNILYSNNSLQVDSQIIDSYSLLKTTLQSFDTIVSMFENYPKYLNDFHLNESNRTARGILIKKGEEMSLSLLQGYLKQFNNLSVSELQVMNNFLKDNFYEVQVPIFGSLFEFKLWEQGHTLADISYTDNLGQKKTFPNITISLDQKEEQLRDLLGTSSDAIDQYRFDFKNFFEITFLKGDSITSAVQGEKIDTSSTATKMSPEIQIFIQKELLEKDFKNIAKSFPIAFSNIYASIQDGNYNIDLNNISKGFAGANITHMVEFQGKYIFNRHTFSRLTFKVKQDNEDTGYRFNETSIEILPARISLLSFPDMIKDLGYYIDAIQSSYTNQQSIVIDLVGKKVILDNIPVLPNFPTR